MEDGDVDIERFRSNGEIHDESMLEELFALWSEEEGPVTQDDATAGK
jgi:hypothetical protein